MISISTLYRQVPLPSHSLRYGPRRRDAGPVVVYNCTARCNLSCVHCYAAAGGDGAGELTTPEAQALIDDLAAANCPVVLFSGGEPVLREDLPELIARAAGGGIRPAVSTNGTLITPQVAERLKAAGAAYVGVSIDGAEQTHNRFRRDGEAFARALAGLEAARAAGMKVGLRMTVTARNAADLEAVFDLVRRRHIPRACFYHLVYTGRGADLKGQDLAHPQRRRLLDRLMDLAASERAAGRTTEILTVDNHADGPYVVLRLLREDPARAAEAVELLRAGGGNASGVRLACVGPRGDVLPDQFWHTQVLGNVRRRPFSRIWADESSPMLAALRHRPRPVKGRCRHCRWMDVCNGNLRARAEAATGDPWAPDPACYLTDEEIEPDPRD